MIQQGTSVNITLQSIERVCSKFDIRLKESHKAILAILIPAVIYRDGSIIILSETIHQINRIIKKHNESVDFISILLAYNCISHIDKYGAITIPLCFLLNKLTVNREVIGYKEKYLSKKVLTNATQTLCISEMLSHIGIPYLISIPIINIMLELMYMDIDGEYKAMLFSNVAFKNVKMSKIRDVLKQMQFEKIFLSTAILLVISNVGLKIGSSLILIHVLSDLFYVIKAELKVKNAKRILK